MSHMDTNRMQWYYSSHHVSYLVNLGFEMSGAKPSSGLAQ